MYQQQQWPEPIATFVLNNENETSYVVFGGTAEGSYTGKFIHQKLYKADHIWWTMHLQKVQIGSTANKDVLKTKGALAIADTGTSLLVMLASDYADFKNMVEAASPDFKCNTLLYDYCYSETNTCDAYWNNL